MPSMPIAAYSTGAAPATARRSARSSRRPSPSPWCAANRGCCRRSNAVTAAEIAPAPWIARPTSRRPPCRRRRRRSCRARTAAARRRSPACGRTGPTPCRSGRCSSAWVSRRRPARSPTSAALAPPGMPARVHREHRQDQEQSEHAQREDRRQRRCWRATRARSCSRDWEASQLGRGGRGDGATRYISRLPFAHAASRHRRSAPPRWTRSASAARAPTT